MMSVIDVDADLGNADWIKPRFRAAGGPGSGNFGHAGRPGEVGGSASSTLGGADKLNLSPGLIREFDDLKRGGNWRLQLAKENKRSVSQTNEYSVVPMTMPERIQETKTGQGYRSQSYYDPELATVVEENGLVSVRLKPEFFDSIQETSEPGYLYRGLSWGEWKAAQRTGEIGSEGTYNLGESQIGKTYFSTDVEQAQSYASGFAPWQYKPTFDRPAVVIKIKDPGTGTLTQGTEMGIPGRVPISQVLDMWEGHPYQIKPGMLELYSEYGRRYQEGSRVSPSVFVAWKPTKLRTAAFDPNQLLNDEESLRTAKEPPGKKYGSLSMRFDVKTDRAINWAKRHAAELVTNVSKTTKQEIKNAIVNAFQQGTLRSAYKDILAAVGDKVRATTIARTESMRAANAGQREAWYQAKKKGIISSTARRVWIYTDDGAVCDECADLDGETAALNGKYPGDGDDGPPLHPRCRCTEGLVADDEFEDEEDEE